MKRTKTPPQIFVVLPGVKDWELWRWRGSEGKCVAQAESPSALHPPHDSTICLPAAETASAAIWLTTADESMIAEMSSLQAEALFPRDNDENLKASRSIRREESRILVFVVSSPADPPSLKGISLAARCVPAFSVFAFPPNSLTIFRELGALVAVLTSGDHPFGVLRLGASTLNSSAASELLCFVMRLSAERVAHDITSAGVWSEPFEI